MPKFQIMRNDRENIIVVKSVNFSLALITYCEVLEQERKFVIANQLLRSGTSIGANIFEAQNAESRNDFIHKMKIAAKEASESLYWLLLCEKSQSYPFDKQLKNNLEEIIKLPSRIIASSKR